MNNRVECYRCGDCPDWHCKECDGAIAILDARKGHKVNCRFYVDPTTIVYK